MLLASDHLFCHRGRTNEGKDGNPSTRSASLCNSIMENDGSGGRQADRLKPSRVLGYEVGDEIRLSEADFGYVLGVPGRDRSQVTARSR